MPHALIIEDEFYIAMGIKDALHKEGFDSFDFAATSKQAYDAVTKRRPQLMTVDLVLLEGKGTEIASAIHDKHGDIPTIYITALSDWVTPRPQDHVLTKPYSDRHLSHAVRDLMA